MVLVAAAGLLLSTFRTLSSLDPGFDRSRVLLVNMDLRNSSAPPENRGAFYREMLAKLRADPGVRSAALSAITPICGCAWSATR